MKISYNKGCYSESIFCEEDKNSFNLKSHNEPENVQEWNVNTVKIKEILKSLINKLDEENVLFNYQVEISHDYENSPICTKEEQIQALLVYVDNYEINDQRSSIYRLFEFFRVLIEAMPSVEETEYYSCDTCGDTNYNYEIEL